MWWLWWRRRQWTIPAHLARRYGGPPRTDGNFVDYRRIRVVGGAGGGGSTNFDRSPRIPRGRPSGGNGGRGGHVVIVSDASLDSLGHLPTVIRAESGGTGGKNMREGAAGEDYIVRVPIGTMVNEVVLPEDECEMEGEDNDGDIIDPRFEHAFVLVNEKVHNDSDAIALDDDIDAEEMSPPGPQSKKIAKASVEERIQDQLDAFEIDGAACSSAVVARGGRGGRGNYQYGRNNRECEDGQSGECRVLELNLRTIADVGLVGHPNAGKSSFLAAVSNAHPKVAAYPFTTLNPYVGVIDFADGGRISVADIPGLVEGAHANRGLGHQFLKHITKAKMLALVVDFSQSEPGRDVRTLLRELDLYQAGLAQKCRLIVANKADLIDAPTLMRRVQIVRRQVPAEVEILPISALHSLAITKVTHRMRHFVHREESGGECGKGGGKHV